MALRSVVASLALCVILAVPACTSTDTGSTGGTTGTGPATSAAGNAATSPATARDAEQTAATGPEAPGHRALADPGNTNLDIAMTKAALSEDHVSCIRDLEDDTGFLEFLDPAGQASSEAIAQWVPPLRSCLGDAALGKVALSTFLTPDDQQVACASEAIGGFTDADIAALVAGDDIVRQQLAARCVE